MRKFSTTVVLVSVLAWWILGLANGSNLQGIFSIAWHKTFDFSTSLL